MASLLFTVTHFFIYHVLGRLAPANVSDYTKLGLEKIAQQAKRDLRLVRCPRDSAVMRVTAWRAEHVKDPDKQLQTFDRFPRGVEWKVRDLDVRCPACGRTAQGIAFVVPEPAQGERRSGRRSGRATGVPASRWAKSNTDQLHF